MSREKIFVYTTNQKNLRGVNNRINGLKSEINMNMPNNTSRKLELARMQEAWNDIRSIMSTEEFNLMHAHENRILTPAEKAAEAKALAIKMSENRDSNSI